MQNTIISFFVLILTITASAQDVFEKTAPVNANEKVSFDLDIANQVIIKTWDKREAYLKATVNINDNSDNDKYRLSVEELSGTVKFEAEIEDMDKIRRTTTTSERGVIVRDDDRCIHIEIDYEIYLPENISLDLETISGDIEIFGQEGPMKIKTISGFIDIAIPEDLDADFEMETITGEMFSDLNIDIEGEMENMRFFPGGDVEATLNRGGNLFRLETISGDIYLRKAN